MSDRPNILFLFADQMHAFAMGCMGTEDIHTPNLDKLAREGVLFRNCYSNAPVCTPFRASDERSLANFRPTCVFRNAALVYGARRRV